ncbi:MAG: hypothetical protein IKP73_15365 [Bacteroidales bacterium]|nr:hypothetical protein [Bacteroidales bacterium]MBR4326895.1 hypothetical protein [Bacteroidales bacterium]
MKFNCSNLDYWKMSSMNIADSLNTVEMGCSTRDCRDCDCDSEDDEDNDDGYAFTDEDVWTEDDMTDYMFDDDAQNDDDMFNDD